MNQQPNNKLNNFFAKAFNTAILQKSRLAWVDYLRGLAILLVVYRHVLIGLERGSVKVPDALVTANMIFYSFRMPLFFILSGIFIGGSLKKRSLNKFLYTKFENLLYPYLVWATLQVTLQIILSRYTNATRTPHDYLYILYQPKLLDQFWYLPALFNATLVYSFIKVKLKCPNWLQLPIGLGWYFLAPHIHDISMLTDWMEFYIFFAIGDFIAEQFFHERTQRFLKNPITLLAVAPVFIATQMYYLSLRSVGQIEFLIIALIGCFSMFVLSFRLQSWDTLKFLRVLGFQSLFIYVMHVIIASFVRAILTKIVGIHNPVILLACGIACGVTIPVIFYNLLIKDNFLWFLFSPERPSKKAPAPQVT